MRRFLMILAGAWLASGSNAHANVISDFSSGDDGWRSVTLTYNNPGAPPNILATFIPILLATGGNPGPYIYNPDPNADVQYWLAPAKYLGDQSAAYSLAFSLADSPVNTLIDQADIILTGGGLTLTRQLPSVPNGVWTSYTIPLVAGSWSIDSPSGAAASAAQLHATLASLNGLYIRGEYYLSLDQQSLDSVQLQNTPEPGTMAGLLQGLAVLLIAARRKYHR